MDAVYINLDTRPDRREQFEAECDRMGLSVERLSACRHETPDLGCIRSHITALRRAKDRGSPSILIFEDDFQFLVPKETVDAVLASLPEDYDVVMLSYNLLKGEPYNDRFGRVLEAQTASGYIVHARFYDTLLATLEEGYTKYCETGAHWLYMNDQVWKPLQLTSRWYYSLVRIGCQRPGYSDLRRGYVDYGV